MNQQEILKRKIEAYSFASWELHLFLDSHPENCEAAKKHKECQATLAELTKEYESKYGIVVETPQNTSRWQWVSGPWPWEVEE